MNEPLPTDVLARISRDFGSRADVVETSLLSCRKIGSADYLGDSLAQLDQDLLRFGESGVSHSQIGPFREVIAKAVADGCAVTVSGDMYPELWRTNA